MRKIYLLVLGIAIMSDSVVAQNSHGLVPHGKTLNKNIKFKQNADYRFVAGGSINRTASTNWISYAESMNEYWSNASKLNQNYLFTDSTIWTEFGSGSSATFGSPWVHSLGDVLDVTSDFLRDYNSVGFDVDKTISYTLDSMAMIYSYTRVTADSIIDTLIVNIYKNNSSAASDANLPTYYFTGQGADFGSDTVSFKSMQYDYTKNMPEASNMITMKLPLSINDTAETFWGEKIFSTNSFSVPAGKLLAVAVTFKPGMAYSLNDTIGKQVNSFIFASYEEQGDETFPLYTYCANSQLGTNDACDWNVSSIITSDVRYNLDPSPGWNGLYIPTWAYTVGYAFEHHLFSYQVTTPTLIGIEENSINNNAVTLYQNIPNPANESTTINYTLNKAALVNIEFYDITGKKVKEINEGQMSVGNHKVDVNTRDLSKGVYFYTLRTAGSAPLTQRMIITK